MLKKQQIKDIKQISNSPSRLNKNKIYFAAQTSSKSQDHFYIFLCESLI